MNLRRTSLATVMAFGLMSLPLTALAQSMSMPVLVQTTPHYSVALNIGPPAEMITPGNAMSGGSGEVMLNNGSVASPSMPSTTMSSGMSSSSAMGSTTSTMTDQGMPVNHQLEVHISQNGMVVDSVTPVIRVTDTSTGQFRDLPAVMGMYSAQMGMSDFHYGQNVYLPDGTYLVEVMLGNDTATYHDVMVSGGSSMMATGGSMGNQSSMGMGAPAASNPLVATDGATLAGQPADVQSMFNSIWGARAAAEWVSEHNTMLGMH
jgi:hypothetical protein